MTLEDKIKDLQWEYEEIIAEKDAVISNLQKETARKLKVQGVSAEIIANTTGLSFEEIGKL